MIPWGFRGLSEALFLFVIDLNLEILIRPSQSVILEWVEHEDAKVCNIFEQRMEILHFLLTFQITADTVWFVFINSWCQFKIYVYTVGGAEKLLMSMEFCMTNCVNGSSIISVAITFFLSIFNMPICNDFSVAVSWVNNKKTV